MEDKILDIVTDHFNDANRCISLTKDLLKFFSEHSKTLEQVNETKGNVINWVAITDNGKLPEDQDVNDEGNDSVLVYGKYGIQEGMYMNGEFYKDYSCKFTKNAVTHWAKLPKPPCLQR